MKKTGFLFLFLFFFFILHNSASLWECRGSKWTKVTSVLGQESQVEPCLEMAGCIGGGGGGDVRAKQDNRSERGRRSDERERQQRSQWEKADGGGLEERGWLGWRIRGNKERARSLYAVVSGLTCLKGEHFMLFYLDCCSLAVRLRRGGYVGADTEGFTCSTRREESKNPKQPSSQGSRQSVEAP